MGDAADEPDHGEEEEPEVGEDEEEAPPAVEAPAAKKKPPPPLRRMRKLRCLLLSKYEEVWAQAEGLGWTPLEFDEGQPEPTNYHICWSDNSVTLERVMKMGKLQRINHFPGMIELVRKAGTARNLNRMAAALGKVYKFFPRTFMLPADYTDLKKEFNKGKGSKTFIIKPSRGCQARLAPLDCRVTSRPSLAAAKRSAATRAGHGYLAHALARRD